MNVDPYVKRPEQQTEGGENRREREREKWIWMIRGQQGARGREIYLDQNGKETELEKEDK